MCGIAGFVDFRETTSEDTLRKMTTAMAHRGPDDAGIFMYNHTVGLGHRRLSIIDISSGGHQPMHFQHLSIVFNGEIYNYKEVRKSLEAEGYTFDTNSDTGVILRAFHRWGTNAVHRFIGMFSFAIIDANEQKLYLFRDRAGVKPLYYYQHGDLLLFASELKAFHQHPQFIKALDMNALGQYFLYGYILAPSTIFENTFKLSGGHFLTLDLKSRATKIEKYWDVADYFRKPKLKIDEPEATDEIDRLLKSAFEYRLVADVPVGIFLSGGYDSSAVAGILQSNHTEKLKTFTIGFDLPHYNEAEHAKKVAAYLGTDHTELYCSETEAAQIIPELSFYFDEPFSDSSAIPTILVSRMARKKVTVSLSADGGDELFGGYDKHANVLRALKRLQVIPSFFQKPLASLMNLYPPGLIPVLNKTYRFEHFYHSVGELMRQGMSPTHTLRLMSHRINKRELHRLFKSHVEEPASDFHPGQNHFSNPLDPILAMDYKTYMVDDVLVKVDRATMSVSLEGREPLLDHRIAELMAQIPSSLKIKDGRKKHILKEVTHRYIPDKLLDRPKLGFAIPVVHWFRNELKEIFECYLEDKRLLQQGLFDVDFIKKLKSRYYKGIDQDFEFIWSMLMFQMWYDRWMK